MSRAPVLYTQTRLSILPTSAAQVLHITTESNQQQSQIFGAGRKRPFNEISGLDEDGYTRKCLATEGSVFFRRKERTPRNFSWRVVEDRRVVEIQCVDVVHDEHARGDSYLTYRLALPHDIVSHGVALADPDGADALDVYVLTTAGEIFTFTLKRDLLTREIAPTDFDSRTCFKRYTSSSLAFRRPYRFVAPSSLELVVSLQDGGLLRLQREAKDNGTQWRETFFSEGGWSGTLRSLIPLKRHQTVRYGDVELEPSAAATIAKSPDGKYIWTVSLDHQVRAWSTETGKKHAQFDILGASPEDDGRRQQQYLLGAEQGTLLQIVTDPPSPAERSIARVGEDRQKYYLVTFSPRTQQFRFYSIMPLANAVEGMHLDIEDLCAGQVLKPPIEDLMDTNIWHLQDFHVLPGPGWKGTRLWIRVRSNGQSHIFTMEFDFFDEETGDTQNVSVPWGSGWTVVDQGFQTTEALRGLSSYPGQFKTFTATSLDPNQAWLDFLFVQGRFSAASMETALHIYRTKRKLSIAVAGTGLNVTKAPLQERVTEAVNSKIILLRDKFDHPDYTRYKEDIQEQWTGYFTLLSHIHNLRHEMISLAVDAADELAWAVGADFFAPVRNCDSFEARMLNNHLVPDNRFQSIEEYVALSIFPDIEDQLQSAFLALAKQYLSERSPDLQSEFGALAVAEAIRHDSGDDDHNKKRMKALYAESGLAANITDIGFDEFTETAEAIGGFGNVTADFFVGVLDLLGSHLEANDNDFKVLAPFGVRYMVGLATETLEKERQCLLELLAIMLFMHEDMDHEGLHTDFVDRIGELFDAVVFRLKTNELLYWMARHEIPDESSTVRRSKSVQMQTAAAPMITIMERVAIADWQSSFDGGPEREVPPMSRCLTQWGKRWTFGSPLYEHWDPPVGHTFGTLLKEQQYDLAVDFQQFIRQHGEAASWNKYLQGRLQLITGDYAMASVTFQNIAEEMAHMTVDINIDSASVLSPEEKNYFGEGRAAFYQHITALYEKLKVWSYTAEFARLALLYHDQGPEAERIYQQDRRREDPDSSGMDLIDSMGETIQALKQGHSIREELLGRLFNALLQTARFEEAFDALKQMENLPVKRSELRKLLEACVRQDAVQELLDLPFEEAELVQEADAVLFGLAKRDLASAKDSTGPPFYQILYAFRTQRANFRGAAELLYEHLERLRHTEQEHGIQDPEDETLIHAYVLLINTLACCGEEDAWLLADPIENVHGQGKKRRLVKIADVRREYAAELDKRSDILQGRFPLIAPSHDEMDVL